MSLKVLPLEKKTSKRELDKIPYRLYKIITNPVTNEAGTKVIAKGTTHKVTGKATYYHTIPTGPEESLVMFMVIGGDGSPVFEIPADRLESCLLIGEEDVEQQPLAAVIDVKS